MVLYLLRGSFRHGVDFVDLRQSFDLEGFVYLVGALLIFFCTKEIHTICVGFLATQGLLLK